MKIPRVITRRRVKWVGTMATLAPAILYAAALAHGWEYRYRAKEWSFVAWIMRGRVEARVSLFRPRKEGEGLLVLNADVSPGIYAELFYQNRTHVGETLPHATYPWFEVGPNPRFDWDWRENNITLLHTEAYIAIPLWLPLLLIAAPAAWLWYTDRKVPPGYCPHCRYDLAGLNVRSESGTTGGNGVCPECGEPVDGGA